MTSNWIDSVQNVLASPLLNNTTNVEELTVKLKKLKHLMTKMQEREQLSGGGGGSYSDEASLLKFAVVLSKTTPHLVKEFSTIKAENDTYKQQRGLYGGDSNNNDNYEFLNTIVANMTESNEGLVKAIRNIKAENEILKMFQH